MLLYATRTDVAALNVDIPENLTPHLAKASRLVGRATRHDVYDVDPAGKPTDPRHIEAMRDATVVQVLRWLAADIDPNAGVAGLEPETAESTVLGTTVKVDLTAQNVARVALVGNLDPEAVDILRDANLAGSAVSS